MKADVAENKVVLTPRVRHEPRTRDCVTTLRVSIPPGQELLWKAILSFGVRRNFTAGDLALCCAAREGEAETYLARLQLAGHVRMVGRTQTNEAVWSLVARRHAAPMLGRTGEPDHSHEVMMRVWRCFKMCHCLTLSGLQQALDDKSFPIPLESIRFYVLALAKTGYLVEEPAILPLGEKHYRLAAKRASGAFPPRIYRVHFAYDPNTQRVFNTAALAEEVRL